MVARTDNQKRKNTLEVHEKIRKIVNLGLRCPRNVTVAEMDRSFPKTVNEKAPTFFKKSRKVVLVLSAIIHQSRRKNLSKMEGERGKMLP
jgi:hypothetical protein